ncbi:hypothetical protein [Nannocystis sp.]|uniref:hypothetical protein n=1 Tax=Nannocystis sp. TaxID=1962667 RepID=UPI002428F302|nr:hypothetical protein [Nannocystis sp.]MBK7827053.1 hypothetical protein [Nannocystis sp.]MBK9755910.1 hypothetical protein [Nannocystis sp.]
MASPRLLLALLLLGCPSGPEHAPPQPPVVDASVGDHGEATRAPARDDPPRPDQPATPGPEKPAFSAPKADGSLADTLPPPAPVSGLGGCEGGTRRAGETWKVDCNECSCGDDGQSTCTAMACLPRPVR